MKPYESKAESPTFENALSVAKKALHESHLDFHELDELKRMHDAEIEKMRSETLERLDAYNDTVIEMRGQIQDLIDCGALEDLEKEFETLKAEIEKQGKAEPYFVGFSLGVITELLKEIDVANIREEVESL